MCRIGLLAALLTALALPAAAQHVDVLTEARRLYNERDFDGAIAAAEAGRSDAGQMDASDLIAARAYLERYRQTAADEDLASARIRLRRINPRQLDAREQTELGVGLGTALYFEDLPGAAALVFDSVLEADGRLEETAREKLLDWWASAIDRDARPRPLPERQARYGRVRSRMRVELSENPSSSVAAYWLAAAAAGAGDWQGAWDEALASWVRAAVTADRGAVLMPDLDRLVQRAIVPERAKVIAQSPDQLLQEWTDFKSRWARP
jgi:hypothetical protein